MSARTDAAALRAALAETRRVLRHLGHEVTGDLPQDVRRAIDVERRALRLALERYDPRDEPGARRRIDELAGRAFGSGYRELRALIREELNRPPDPDTEDDPWVAVEEEPR